jgi:isocitrate/isopropylmalate dehydrogenase
LVERLDARVFLARETLKAAVTAKRVLFGAVGGPRWDKEAPDKRPSGAF